MIFRGETLGDPLNPQSDWIQLSETSETLPVTVPPRPASRTTLSHSPIDGIRCGNTRALRLCYAPPPPPTPTPFFLLMQALDCCGVFAWLRPPHHYTPTPFCRYQVTQTVVAGGDMSSALFDTVVTTVQQEVYNIQWMLPAGQGSGQTLQLLVSQAFGDSWTSNIVTIDYDIPIVNRVVTSQCVPCSRVHLAVSCVLTPHH
jgi:hypothetical protein